MFAASTRPAEFYTAARRCQSILNRNERSSAVNSSTSLTPRRKRSATSKWLVQGTLYPDVIESVSVHGSSVTIKSHHNVGGLPEKMKLKLIEPLRELFKDEVRLIGRDLGHSGQDIRATPVPRPRPRRPHPRRHNTGKG